MRAWDWYLTKPPEERARIRAWFRAVMQAEGAVTEPLPIGSVWGDVA